MTKYSADRRDVCDAIALGRAALGECFRAMHSTVASDSAAMSRVGGGWPAFLRDEPDLDAEPRKHYTAAQLTRAEQMCQAFADMPQPTHEAKREAVRHSMMKYPSWSRLRGLASRPGVEAAYVGFAYLLAEREGLTLGDMREVYAA